MLAEVFDLLLDTQLLPFQVHDGEMVDRAMGCGFGDFFFKVTMLPLQITQLGLYHLECPPTIVTWPQIVGKTT